MARQAQAEQERAAQAPGACRRHPERAERAETKPYGYGPLARLRGGLQARRVAASSRQAFWKRLLRELEQGSSVREVAVRHAVNGYGPGPLPLLPLATEKRGAIVVRARDRMAGYRGRFWWSRRPSAAAALLAVGCSAPPPPPPPPPPPTPRVKASRRRA